MRLLLVEDDPMLGAAIERGLRKGGFAVDWAETAEAALAAARAQGYDAILLDLALPDGGGLDVLRSLRSARDMTPVIIITASGHLERKVEGLDAGADDYVVKPFDLDELVARIRANVRRHELRPSDVLSVGEVTVDLAARLVRKGDEPANVTAKEFRVLSALLRRAGQFVSKNELESALYDDASDVESNTIEVTIYGLRKKLGSSFIVTARGLGYMVPK
jgi:two-component system OmpR family response regulator/two-component system response regulator QseB